ncbi:MAG: ATP-binding protein, partial [Candidatus Yanofskybacteria bacterium]|nr:ATP-binding protein [Candidatus Yanofskybacteria bacterium]
YQRLCEKKNLSLKFIQHPEKFAVVTDFNLLECILQNLVTNAIDYTPAAGKIDVLLENRNNLVVIQVKDTGIGIPKNEQSRVFERFTRASNAVIAKTDGTGLGLYIAQQAAKLLGGKLSFESEVGKGSTFFVEFPGRFS